MVYCADGGIRRASAAYQDGLWGRRPRRQPVLYHHGVLVAQFRHRQPRSGRVAGRCGAAAGTGLGRGDRSADGDAVGSHRFALGASAAVPAVRSRRGRGGDDAGVPGGGRPRLEPGRPVRVGGIRVLPGEQRLHRRVRALRGAHPGVGAGFPGAHQPQRLPHGVGDRRHAARRRGVHHRGRLGSRCRSGIGLHGGRGGVRADHRAGGADHLRLGAGAAGGVGPGRRRAACLRPTRRR